MFERKQNAFEISNEHAKQRNQKQPLKQRFFELGE